MGVENNIGEHSVGRPGYVLARPFLTGNALLPGTRGEFVPDRRVPGYSKGNDHFVLETRPAVVGAKFDRVHYRRLLAFVLLDEEL